MADATVPIHPTAPAARFEVALGVALSALGGSANALVTAVSGGADSMALALLADRFARQAGFTHHPVIIDHGLRAESGDEARDVASRLAAIGMSADIHTVAAPPPSSGIQSWARDQRYQLLLNAARELGGVLLTGHHRNDQAETVFMRLQRGSGIGGLAGMREISCRAGVAVIRPLLDISRDELEALCHQRGAEFIQDPSNADHRFERVRIRKLLATMKAGGSGMPDQICRLADYAARIDDRLFAALAADGSHPVIHPAGYADLPKLLLTLPQASRHRILSWIVSTIGNGRVPPTVAATTALADRMMKGGRSATLGGCQFLAFPEADQMPRPTANRSANPPKQQVQRIMVVAEPGRRPPLVSMTAGQRVIFANRWCIKSPQAGTVRYLGSAGSGAGGDWQLAEGWQGLPASARRALPVIESLDGDLLYPHLVRYGQAHAQDGRPTAEFLPMCRVRLAGHCLSAGS